MKSGWPVNVAASSSFCILPATGSSCSLHGPGLLTRRNAVAFEQGLEERFHVSLCCGLLQLWGPEAKDLIAGEFQFAVGLDHLRIALHVGAARGIRVVMLSVDLKDDPNALRQQ